VPKLQDSHAEPAQGKPSTPGDTIPTVQPGSGSSRPASKRSLALEFVLGVILLLAAFLVFSTARLVWERQSPPVFSGAPVFLNRVTPPQPPPPPIPPPPSVISIKPSITVFFPNARGVMDPDEVSRLDRIALALRQCTFKAVEVYGSASSTPFLNDPNDDQNVDLARIRAEAVAGRLNFINPSMNAKAVPFTKVKRLYADLRTADSIENPLEALNRRADVVLIDPSCANSN